MKPSTSRLDRLNDFWLVKENFRGNRFENYMMPGETSNKNMEDFGKNVEILQKVGE